MPEMRVIGEKNVHSKNDKANKIIYLLGAACFIKNLDMTKISKSKASEQMHRCNPIYLVKDKAGSPIQEIGFEDTAETMHVLDYANNETQDVLYDEIIKQFIKKLVSTAC